MIKSIILSIFITSAAAFAPANHGHRVSSALFAESSAEAIQNALAASKKFGATSKEARVAWDIVEEINASDNSAAYTGGKNLSYANTPEAQEYAEKVIALSKILDEQKAQIESVKDLASKIRAIKIVQPKTSPRPVSDAMAKALADAKAMSEKHGANSSEAKLAWETVEDIASDNYSEAMKKDLSDECLLETIEACEAIEEIQKALHQNENKGSGRYSG